MKKLQSFDKGKYLEDLKELENLHIQKYVYIIMQAKCLTSTMTSSLLLTNINHAKTLSKKET